MCADRDYCGHYLNCLRGECRCEENIKNSARWQTGWDLCQKSPMPCPTADDHDYGGCKVAFHFRVVVTNEDLANMNENCNCDACRKTRWQFVWSGNNATHQEVA